MSNHSHAPDLTLVLNLQITAACVGDATRQIATVIRRQPVPETASWKQELAVARAYLGRAQRAQEHMRT